MITTKNLPRYSAPSKFRLTKLVGCASAVLLVTALLTPPAAVASLLGYYPLDIDGNDYSTNAQNLTWEGTGNSNGIPAMFGGGAYEAPDNAGNQRLERVDTNTPNLYDTTFTNFSASIWVKPTSWSDAQDRYIMGKFDNATATPPNERWNIRKAKAVGAIIVLMTSGDQVNFDVTGGDRTAEDPAVFHHVMFTYQQTQADAFGTNATVKLFFDGMIDMMYTSFPTPYLSGANSKAFQIGNEGDNRNSSSQKSWNGSLDDAAVWNETISDAKVALIHGLGRLAGVSLGARNQRGTDTQIHDVYAAYTNQTYAAAGGYFWQYNTGNGPVRVGSISGSVATRDAFIALGDDGSGMLSGKPVPSLTSVVTVNGLELSWPETGWWLQCRTNALDLGNWAIVPGSTNINHLTVTLDPANKSVFYRLVYPD